MSVILDEKQDNIGIITLNRPDKRNALNTELLNGLGDYLHQANDDPEVKVIVIRGAGEKAFTAGFDLKESMNNNITDIVERRADTQHELDFFRYLWYLPKPVISAVQGYCIGGGNTIALMSDLIIAADNATFGNPEIVLGDASYQAEYAEVLYELERAGKAGSRGGVVVGDMTAIHQQLLKTKRFFDMTANNVNHPNDFLIRAYAQLVTTLLIAP